MPSTSDGMYDDKQLLKNEKLLRHSSDDEVSSLKSQVAHWKRLEVWFFLFNTSLVYNVVFFVRKL